MSGRDELERTVEELGENFDPRSQGIESRWGAETEQLYRAKGFGTRIGWGERPAVVVIDMARAFCDPSYKVGCDQTETLEAIAQVLAVARAAELPVYFTTIAYLPDGQDGGMFVKKVPLLLELQLDDPGSTEIDPRIAPVEGEVIVEKKYASAFFETSFNSMLASRRVDTLVVTGCSTSGCVRATAIDAVSHGYRVIVPADAVSDRAPGPHYANLFDIDAKYGDVVPLTEVVEHLEVAAIAGAGRVASQAG